VLVLGGGSNLLCSDDGFAGLVVRYTASAVDPTLSDEPDGASAGSGEQIFRVEAGAALASLARRFANAGWAGLEWAEGIPGTVGGAIAGNAGAYGGDIAHCLVDVEVHTAGSGTAVLTNLECDFGYRRSVFQRTVAGAPAIILAGRFRLRKEDPESLRHRIREIAAQRRSRTPAGLSCGSVFRNPPGASAGALIEAAGLKGATRGQAQISTQHANYIINRGGASAGDVMALIVAAREAVWRTTGIELQLEVRCVGWSPPPLLA